MPVTSVAKDPAALTMNITAEYAAPADRVWQLWDDPRQLEKWWGPPMYPATFVEHDLTAGATVTYFMTGPEGDQPKGWWRVLSVDAPHHLEFEDGFADDDWQPNPALPVMVIRVVISDAAPGTTRMSVLTTFPSVGAMEQVLAMGMEEGMTEAIGQIDALLGSVSMG